MKINRLTEIDVEKEYDKIDDDYQVLSELIQELYKEGSTVDPETHAFLKRQKILVLHPTLKVCANEQFLST